MTKVSLLTVLIFILPACNFSKGVKADLSTGLTASYNGFAIEDIYLSEGDDGKKLNSNKITLGSPVNVQVTGVENYKEENGIVFPGCQMILTDSSGTTLLNIPDLFADKTAGFPKAEATTLRAKLSTGEPMAVGRTYKLKCRFYDKKKKESEIVANVDLVIK
jgi:hypothetical protein